MISRFCKTLSSIRAAASFVVSKEDLNSLQKHLPLITTSNRYYDSKNAADQHSFAVSYLMNSCGLSPESALRVSKRVRFETPKKPDAFLCFLKKHGFSQPQIINIIERRPMLLLYDVEKNLSPKFEFFYSKGLTNWHIAKHPYILERSLHGSVIPNFNFFKTLTRHNDDKKVLLALFGGTTYLLQFNYQSLFVSNLRLLREYGVPESYATTVCIQYPLMFILKHDKFKAAVEQVMKLGFDPLKYAFLDAVHNLIIRCKSKSTWDSKFSLYKKWGWSDEEIWSAFRKLPRIMQISQRNINATMDFYVNKMGYKSQHFAKRPSLLLWSLEKRITPRCSVLQYLLSKGLIKEDYDVQRMLICTEKQFTLKFLTPFKDPHLLKLYEEKLGCTK
ncbi:hypothetical protein DITRI_Ditri08aG0016700 [Diplodiscus trichospermus]